MKSVTFTITAEKWSETALVVTVETKGLTVLKGWMLPREWDAFKSLLIPSPKADFVLKEGE
jgi:hypothetical protein